MDHGTIVRLPPSALRVHASLLLVSALFGANYVFTKLVLHDVSASSWVLFRIAAAAIVFVPLALRFGKTRPTKRLVLWLLLAALLGVVLNQILFTIGLSHTTPAHSAVINACIPTWTLLLSVCLGQERFSTGKVLAVVVALLGIGTLLHADEMVTGGLHLSPEQLTGDLATWANGVSFSLHLILMRRIGPKVDPWISTAVMFCAATVLTSAWSLPQMTTADLQAVVTPPVVWYALYGVLFATVLTYLINTWALQHTRSSQVALYINVQPLIAVGMGPFFDLPAPDWRFGVALASVALGLVLQTRAR
ncbi:MAG: DMT family transporter [Planctomycetota bacterium]|jgi:drug/metabolite transporter (DMT)-like permease